jgi:micrococcal nuclease
VKEDRIPVAMLLGLAVVTVVVSAGTIHDATVPQRFSDANAVALDGDTIKLASGQRLRLLEIDAPELPGHCRSGRTCVPGNPYLAKHALQSYLQQGIRCVGTKRDFYNRLLVHCYTLGGKDIGQQMLSDGIVSLYHRSH